MERPGPLITRIHLQRFAMDRQLFVVEELNVFTGSLIGVEYQNAV